MTVTADIEELRRQLAEEAGISAGFHDIWGNYHPTSNHTRDRILDALQLNADSLAQLNENVTSVRDQKWLQAPGPVLVHRQHTMPLSFALVNLYKDQSFCVRMTADNGHVQEIQCNHDTLEIVESREFNDELIEMVRVPVQPEPTPGYYRVEVYGDNDHLRSTSLLIVAPSQCWWPEQEQQPARCFGVSLQLYSVRSSRNWGIGDFTDLSDAIRLFAGSGVDVVGLNPLHALLPNQPEQCSPYFPSSRYFRNVLYLDPEALPEYQQISDDLKQQFESRRLKLCESELVDYPGVADLKYAALQACYEVFCNNPLNQDYQKDLFVKFETEQGEQLKHFSEFEAGQCDTPFSDARQSRYLQWRSDQQLARCAKLATDLGMRIGLYNDLAVGSNGDGADADGQPMLFLRDIEIGAPPDDFSPQGQSWGLPPMSPVMLKQQQYDSFIKLLRHNMTHAGVIRIDHVMGLMHQFWIPKGMACNDGAYVQYPLHDLLSIVALESHRMQCAVIGEDLGTVPVELRQAIHEHGILSTRLLYFEKDWHGDHSFLDPASYPEQAAVTVGSHDLPTLYGYWAGKDLDQLKQLDRLGDQRHIDEQYQNRQYDRERLIHLLQRNDKEFNIDAFNHDIDPNQAIEMATSVYQLLGHTPCRLVIVQLSDVFAEKEQTNVPGTIDEYPNWRRRLTPVFESWADHRGLRNTLKSIAAQRGKDTD